MEYFKKDGIEYKNCKFRNLNHNQTFYTYVPIRGSEDLEEIWVLFIKTDDKSAANMDGVKFDFWGDDIILIKMDPL